MASSYLVPLLVPQDVGSNLVELTAKVLIVYQEVSMSKHPGAKT